jgi:hypothetical protein
MANSLQQHLLSTPMLDDQAWIHADVTKIPCAPRIHLNRNISTSFIMWLSPHTLRLKRYQQGTTTLPHACSDLLACTLRCQCSEPSLPNQKNVQYRLQTEYWAHHQRAMRLVMHVTMNKLDLLFTTVKLWMPCALYFIIAIAAATTAFILMKCLFHQGCPISPHLCQHL